MTEAPPLPPCMQVIKLAEAMVAAPPKTEDEVKPLEQLIGEAFQEIDKAVVKGILHQNTAARKKARCSRYKKQVRHTAYRLCGAGRSA